MLQGGKRLYK